MKLREHLNLIASCRADEDERIARIRELLTESDNYTAEERNKIGSVLAEIIENQAEDVVLRQHAANEIGYYSEAPSPTLRERFYDPDEDADVRYNLQSSFKADLPIDALKTTNPEQGGDGDAEEAV